MINYIKKKDLDIVKYDACIENSLQSNIYGFSWYLDIVAENWDVLVLDDYDAVMPIPWRNKFFVKYVYQPFFTQQLGVFSSSKLEDNTIKEFSKILLRRFLKVHLQLNAFNKINGYELRINYTLSLNDSYEKLFKNFSKGRKHAVNSGKKLGLKIKEIRIEDLILISKEFYQFSLKNDDYYRLKKISKKGKVIGVYSNEDELLGGALFFKTSKRFIYLFSGFTDFGKKLQSPSFLLNYIIEENSENKVLLDFEGSMIRGIASFYKSFGAKKEEYYLIRTNRITSFFSLSKR